MNKDITKFDREKWCKNSAGKNGAKFGRKKWCKIRPENCCKDWPKVVAKVGQKLRKSAEKCCKESKMRSISAMNSHSSMQIGYKLRNLNLNLRKYCEAPTFSRDASVNRRTLTSIGTTCTHWSIGTTWCTL